MRPRVTEWVKVFASVCDQHTLAKDQEDYEVYIAPETGIYEYGIGILRVKATPTLKDGRAFANYFIDRQMEDFKLNSESTAPESYPFPLVRRSV